MKTLPRRTERAVPLIAGLLVGLICMFLVWSLSAAGASAAPPAQDDDPADPTIDDIHGEAAECQECHLDVARHWSTSPHAHAFDDPVFQERWDGLGAPGECLVCHTTGFRQSTGEFDAEGIQCVACHGETPADHPPAAVAIKADTEYCGICHTTTLSEWRLTGHSTEGIGCASCHDPHSQQALFAEPDDLCLNCHADSMGDYLEDLHVQKGIGCVDCHQLVIPPEVEPVDGIVPTGHTFTITPATCVACHTDALHAGFSLPGYEHGAKAAAAGDDGDASAEMITGTVESAAAVASPTEMSPDQRIQTLEASLASRNMGLLLQGAIIGLVFGGSTAWLVGQNLKRNRDTRYEIRDTSEERASS